MSTQFSVISNREQAREFINKAVKKNFFPLFVLSAITLAGCSSVPVTPSPAERAQIRNIHIVPSQETTQASFKAFASTEAEGVWKGALSGGFDGIAIGVGLTAELVAETGIPWDVWVNSGMAAKILGPIVLLVFMVPGSIEGGKLWVSEDMQRKINQHLTRLLESENLNPALANRVFAEAIEHQELIGYNFEIDPDPDPASFTEQDALLEVSIKQLGLTSVREQKASLFVSVNARLIRTRDGEELTGRNYIYIGKTLPLEVMFSNRSKRFLSEYYFALTSLSRYIVEEMLIITEDPFDQTGLAISWAHPGGYCWLQPLQPAPAKRSFLQYLFLQPTSPENAFFDYTVINTRQPEFRWEPFPHKSVRTKQNLALIDRISDVVYDMKVFQVLDHKPFKLVYQVTDLAEPFHKMDVDLKKHKPYYWTVRARYKMDGQAAATRWARHAVGYHPHHDKHSPTQADDKHSPTQAVCYESQIPDPHYFRFKVN